MLGFILISIHWLSDVMAGGLIGIAIGLTIGESFSEVGSSRSFFTRLSDRKAPGAGHPGHGYKA